MQNKELQSFSLLTWTQIGSALIIPTVEPHDEACILILCVGIAVAKKSSQPRHTVCYTF